MFDFANWPGWGWRLAWTLGTLGVAWGVGRVLASVVVSRVEGWLPGRHHDVARAAATVLRRQLPCGPF
jgi:hypothetical protein